MDRGRVTRRVIGLLFASLFMIMIFSVAAFAGNSVTAVIPVNQTYTEKNKIPSDLNRTFKYVLTASDSSYPMPSGASNGSYNFSLKSTASTKIEISYTKTGVYKYSLKQVIPDSKISRMTYDEKVYDITVSVKNSGNSLISSVYISESGSSYKNDSANFENSYTGKKSSGGSSDDDDDDDDDENSTSVASSGTGSTAIDSGVLGDREAPDSDSGVLGDKESPDTGDNANPFFWIAMILISMIVIVVSLKGLKTEKKND